MPITVKCHSCQNVGMINKLSMNLTCTCGSRDIDLHDPASVSFLEFMGAAHGPGTGWGQSRPDALDGWSEYAGPAPSSNPFNAPNEPGPCPECHGSKRDPDGEGVCRACGGQGHRTPTTQNDSEPQVARHNYPSTQTKVPFMGNARNADRIIRTPEEVIKRTTPGWNTGEGITDSDAKFPNISPHLKTRDDNAAAHLYSDEGLSQARGKGYAMDEAPCPSCGNAPTHLVNDYKGDAWWHCDNCGPLENIDRKPQIDPYNPPSDFKPNPRSFRTSGKARQKTGRVYDMITVVSTTNPGLSQRHVVGLVLHTARKYQG
jgi:hypothetical protein